MTKNLDLNDLKNYCDLLPKITLKQLKKQFIFVSYCQNSIPGNGSQTYKSEKLNIKTIKKVFKMILHKNKKVTLKTEKGFFQFFN